MHCVHQGGQAVYKFAVRKMVEATETQRKGSDPDRKMHGHKGTIRGQTAIRSFMPYATEEGKLRPLTG